MQKNRKFWIGISAALLLIALGIALAPLGSGGAGGNTSSNPRANEALFELPATAAARTDSTALARSEATGSAPAGEAVTRGTGRVIPVDGGPVPAGTRVVVRFDNPDFMSDMPLSELVRQGFQKGPAGQREMMLEAMRRRKEGASSTVSADGTFQINIPQNTTFYIHVVSDYLYNDRWNPETSASSAPLVVHARRGTPLRGIVKTPTGEPAAGATVMLFEHLMPGAGGRMTTPRDVRAETKTDGTFILGAAPDGVSISILARKAGFATSSAVLKSATADEIIEIVMRPAGKIAGIVTDSAGVPVEGAQLELLFNEISILTAEAERQPAVTNASGAFEFFDLPPGTIRVRAEKKGIRPGTSALLDIRPGTTTSAGIIVLNTGTTIRGRVETPDATPAAGAIVKLEFSGSGGQMEPGEGGANAFDTAETTTNAEGEFTIAGMGVGPYDLEATFPGFAPARKKRYKDQGSPVVLKLKKPGALQCEVTVPEQSVLPATVEVALEVSRPMGPGFAVSETVKKMNVAPERGAGANPRAFTFNMNDIAPGNYSVVARARGFARARVQNIEIKGKQPATATLQLVPGVIIQGRVLDKASRRPLIGAEVGIAGGLLDMFRTDLPRTRANEDGTFELDGVEAGAVSVQATFSGRARSVVPLGNHAAGSIVKDCEFLLSMGGAIEGKAYTDEGFPMAGGIATIQSPAGGDFQQMLVDRDGHFFISKVSPGNYQISVIRGNFMADMGDANPGDILKGMRIASAEVREGETTSIVLGEPGADNLVKVRGRVRAGNDVVSRALITAVSPGAMGGAQPPRFDTTDMEGRFEIKLPSGKAVFVIQRFGTSQSSVEVQSEIPSKATHDLTLQLPMGTLEGVLRGPKGAVLPSQPVALNIEGSGGGLMGSFGQATTDEEGHYKFENLTAGSYVVTAGGTNAFVDNAPASFGRSSRRVELKDGDQVRNFDFTLAPGGDISGLVTSGGVPVPGASIFLQTPDGQVVAKFSDVFTNPAGQFRARGLAPGTYRIMARARGYGSKFIENIQVDSSQDTEVHIQLSPGAAVTAVITTADGKPATGISVSLFDSEGRKLSGVASFIEFGEIFAQGTPGAGEVRLGTLEPGRYRITVTKGDAAVSSTAFEVTSAEPRRIEVRLP